MSKVNLRDTSESDLGMGKAYGSGALFMLHNVGTAKSSDGEYGILTSVTNMAPVVVSEKTGKTFIFDWNELIKHAVDVGKIDEPTKPELIEALTAIKNGEWDNPHLLSVGPLPENIEDMKKQANDFYSK